MMAKGAPGLDVVNWMECREKLCARTDLHIVTDRDRRAVKEDRVIVDETAGADADLRRAA